ncbi:MAG: hypothetical protein KBD01_15840 [Acidobacteria bacterium]|nr:hypothetical protein [Acidobacteriota bacterium]
MRMPGRQFVRIAVAAFVCLSLVSPAALAKTIHFGKSSGKPTGHVFAADATTRGGFGDPENIFAASIAAFRGHIYAGTFNVGVNGAQLFERSGAGWQPVGERGFGNPDNTAIEHLFAFHGRLYAGVANFAAGGAIWRSADGENWEPVAQGGFGEPINTEMFQFAEFHGKLYVQTTTYDSGEGFQVWTSESGDPGSWEKVVTNGFDSADNQAGAFAVFGDRLFAGTWNPVTGAQVYATADGTNWTPVESGGFGSPLNQGINALEAFQGALYAATEGPDRSVGEQGAEVWRCRACDGSDWQRVVENGFGNPSTYELGGLETVAGALVYVVGNTETGLEVWATLDGTRWAQVDSAGLGDADNWGTFLDNSIAAIGGRLYIGTWNEIDGGSVYRSRLRVSRR